MFPFFLLIPPSFSLFFLWQSAEKPHWDAGGNGYRRLWDLQFVFFLFPANYLPNFC
jgi:hypothetical protein